MFIPSSSMSAPSPRLSLYLHYKNIQQNTYSTQ
nr:MAG TPA: hypothetical protein [Caudoviricetes sp.]DAU40879.1 MAG TPA: hypothetical protein [Caudoviricetes sp.]